MKTGLTISQYIVGMVVGLAGSPAFATVTSDESPAFSAEEQVLDVFVVESDVHSVIEALKSYSGERINLTDKVRGRVRQKSLSGGVADILDGLAFTHDLEWFYFNNVYYVSHGSEAISRVVRLGTLSTERVDVAISGAGLVSDALDTVTTPNGEAIVLTGPPKLVAFAEIIIESIPDIQPIVEPATTIRIRRAGSLHYEPAFEESEEATDEQ